MKILYKQSRLVVVFLVSFLSQGQINFSAVYIFGTETNVSSFDCNEPNFTGLTFKPIIKQGVTSSSSQNNFRAKSWPEGATNDSNVFTGVVDLGMYIQFSIAPNPGYRYTISSINFGIGRSAVGTRQSQWRGSFDSFQTVFDNYSNLPTGLTNNSGVLTNEDSNSFWTNVLLSFGANYSDITDDTIFRYYLYNAEAGTGTAGLQGPITITGTFEIFSTRWDGTTWTNGAPTATIDAFIDGDYTTVENEIFISKNVTVNAGKTLTISANHQLSFYGLLLNNGSVIVGQNSNLIQSQ